MLPFGIGLSEIFVVFLVLIVFVGPEGIPQAVRAIARVIRTVRSMVDEVRYSEEFDEVKREILEPLEEARRFNPKRKAEDWVRREIKKPVRKLTQDQVSDFRSAIEGVPNEVGGELNEEFTLDLHTSKSGNEAVIHDDEVETDDEVGNGGSIAAIDPLERKVTQSPTEVTMSMGRSEEVICDDDCSGGEFDEDEIDEEAENGVPIAAIDPLERGLTRSLREVTVEQEKDHG